MSNLTRDIGTDDLKIVELVDRLRKDQFLIPTFQRDFVWDPASIKKLWDSMFRFYPIGSVLYWETNSYLHTHRKLGGFQFPHDEDTVRKFEEWQYILDGQQRATSILVCMLGGTGRVKDNERFDYTLYFDATEGEFFFADDLEKRKAAAGDERFLIRVRDVPEWTFTFYKDISAVEGFDDTIEHNLQQIQRMFTDYKISVIFIKGVEVNEVCEIFERINQEGKKLDPVDIIVARTYDVPNPQTGDPGFYLRDNLAELREKLVGTRWADLDSLLVVQMVAVCLRKEYTGDRNPFGITPRPLDNLTSAHFKARWDECEKTVLNTIKFLRDLKIVGPQILPYGYLVLPLCYHFHQNPSPDRDVARQWFWRNSFGLSNFTSSDVYQFSEVFFRSVEGGGQVSFEPLYVSESDLISASYYYRNATSRAVLAFLAYLNPKDFTDPDAEVLDNVYLLMAQAPNLHHIYPHSFLKKRTDLPESAPIDSLMNICYLRARTNIKIGDDDPLEYLQRFSSVRDFGSILDSHLIPEEFTKRMTFTGDDYREFLLARAGLFLEKLTEALPDVSVNIPRRTILPPSDGNAT